MGTAHLAKIHRRRFPKSLDGAPILLPTNDTAIRRQLDRWIDKQGIRPVVVGEFEDFALLVRSVSGAPACSPFLRFSRED
jgi:LysR family transcriptional activator of nhaA